MRPVETVTFWFGFFAASAFWVVLVAIMVGCFLERRGPVVPWPSAPPPRPSCPICGVPMERVAAILEDDAWEFAEQGLPAPDYFCPRPSCHTVDHKIVYCYAVRPGEPVRLSPAKTEPEGDLA
jgi:hypothetical protein